MILRLLIAVKIQIYAFEINRQEKWGINFYKMLKMRYKIHLSAVVFLI